MGGSIFDYVLNTRIVYLGDLDGAQVVAKTFSPLLNEMQAHGLDILKCPLQQAVGKNL